MRILFLLVGADERPYICDHTLAVAKDEKREYKDRDHRKRMLWF